MTYFYRFIYRHKYKNMIAHRIRQIEVEPNEWNFEEPAHDAWHDASVWAMSDRPNKNYELSEIILEEVHDNA